jgi:WD40 repeat protein
LRSNYLSNKKSLMIPLDKKSKFKNLLGTLCAKNQFYTNLNSVQTKNSNDSNVISANEEFFAIPWGSNSMFVGHRQKSAHKAPLDPYLVNGHKLGITDSQFSPFVSNLLATSSVDATVKLWKLPNDVLKENIEKETCNLQHDKKINLIQFHPTVSDVLVSASFDNKIRLWDLNHSSEPVQTIEHHNDIIQSISWNHDGSAFVSSCRDKLVRIVDPRSSNVMMVTFYLTH